ncbi:MAG: glucose-6-phosphate dehydrogenase [Deltaproteobacteria bacterium]|nr:glucose-6-phosphate dehydrogenase [Deltaproteobacteria bacterium]
MESGGSVANPFRAGLPASKTAGPSSIIIFGASGDLTARKLVPALYDLAVDGLLPRVAILGASRSDMSDDAFRASLLEGVAQHARHRPVDQALWSTFAASIHYQAVAYDDAASMKALAMRLMAIDQTHAMAGNHLFYLSTPPTVFGPIVRNLGVAGLATPGDGLFARVIIEKPFGVDLATAMALNREIREVLSENQIFRIDHYLGKETVQNLLVMRFANGIFEPLWNNKYVDHVQITGAEVLGVERRSAYFERAGILRDMVQNHLLQVLSLAAMEPPGSFEADAVRNEKVKVVQALRPIEANDPLGRVIRGQYASGSILGDSVPAYRDEAGVQPRSTTETFVALKLFIDNWRWAGVPFYLRSGKRLPKRVTEVAFHFKAAPHRLFKNAKDSIGMEGNVLAIRIQPDEGIALSIGAKVPAASMEIAPVSMEFRYASSFGRDAPAAYERLLLDALSGDGTLFTRGDEVEATWRFITPIHEAWAASTEDPEFYEAGTWGPRGSVDLLRQDGRSWRRP